MEETNVKMDRRSFLKRSTLVAGGVVTATTLQTLAAHSAWARDRDDDWKRGREDDCRPGKKPRRGNSKDYGSLKPTALRLISLVRPSWRMKVATAWPSGSVAWRKSVPITRFRLRVKC